MGTKKIVKGDEEFTQTELVRNETDRGFGRIEFEDKHEIKCSLQDSSLATEPAIWFGCDDANPKIMKPGQGWVEYPIPEEVSLRTRMHLTQAMVKQLLPYLTEFAKTGKYISQMKLKKS